MIVNKIQLKNYRIHDTYEVPFEKGLNLILGKNGAGKSSIIEALGFVLFNANLRTKNQTDAVKIGEKNALVNVEFTGNDGNDYIIERKIGSNGYVRLFVKGEESSRIENVADVYTKIKELAGISYNEINIYENVITSKQNKFINIFLGTATEREKDFDRIFNTEIYREMYDKYTRNAVRKYELDLVSCKQRIEDINLRLKDKKKLNNNLKEIKKSIKDCDNKLQNINSILKDLEKEKEQLNKLKIRIDSTNKDISHKNEMIISKEKSIEEFEKNLNESINSKSIVDENRKDHDKYEEKQIVYSELLNKIDNLEKKESYLNQLKDELSSAREKISKYNESKKNYKNNFKEKNIRLNAINENITVKENEINEIQNDIEKVRINKDIKEKIYKQFIYHYQKIKDVKNKIKKLKDNKEYVSENIKNIDELLKHKINFENKKNEYNKKIKIKNELIFKRNNFEERLKELNISKKSLQGGVCPLLKEECQNIKNNKNGMNYFDERKIEIENEINNLSEEIEKYKYINDELEIINKNIHNEEKEIENENYRQLEIEKLNNDIVIHEKEYEILRLQIKDILKNENNQVNDSFENKDFDSINNFLLSNSESLKEKLKINCDIFNDKQNDIKIIKNEKYTVENHIKKQKQEYEESLKNIYILENKIISIEKEQKKISEEIKKLPDFKKERSELNIILSKLKNNYDLFNKNINKSIELNKYKKMIEKIKSEIEKFKLDVDTLTNKINDFEKDFSEVKLTKVIEKINEGNINKDSLIEKLSEYKSQFELIKRDIDENNKLLEDVKINKDLEKKLNEKINLAVYFRNNLKDMGKTVASQLLRKIELKATDNFRNITGRNEEIRWINNEKESYTIYLVKSNDINNASRFDVLSGGEQVAVALSVRSALASLLTKSNFIIMDEPTINLDLERRISLAENLKVILQNLNQAIVITHDNNFDEMAQNVIRL